MTETARIDRTPTTTAATRPPDRHVTAADAAWSGRREEGRTRTVLIAAVAAVAVLVLLMPATPLVGVILIAAVSLGVVATLVGHAEDRRTTGEALSRLPGRGYLVLEERVAPGLTGTVGHLVIGPGGVFVVETREYAGRVRIRGDQLIVGRHSHSVATRLRAQTAAIARALEVELDGTGATVVPLVCIRRAELPLLHRSVAGIPLLRESQLERRIAHSAVTLDEQTIGRLGELADRVMPRSPGRRPAMAASPAMSVPTSPDAPPTPTRTNDALGFRADASPRTKTVAIPSTRS